MLRSTLVIIVTALALAIAPASAQEKRDTYSEDEILAAAKNLFGKTTAGLAKAIEYVFQDLGRPNGFIEGEEFGGAFFVGLRYGEGMLNRKGVAAQKIYWQGPSVGFDFGGNASKVLTLVYNMNQPGDIYRRIPGVDGSFYLVAGVSLNYQRVGKITLAPIRTGVGLRAGANVGYLHYNQEHSWLPF